MQNPSLPCLLNTINHHNITKPPNSALQLTIRGYLQQCRNSTQEECQALERF